MTVGTILFWIFVVVLFLVALQLAQSAAGVIAGLPPLALAILILGFAWYFGYI